ncbi:uncharacterized protein METZ01_LOCUS406081, partial [marine metagenome]
AVRDRAHGQDLGRAGRCHLRHRPPRATQHLHPRPHLGLHLRRRDRPAQPGHNRHGPDLLRGRLPPCRLDLSPHPRGGDGDLRGSRPLRRGDLQAPAWQRHRLLRARALRHHGL